MRELLETLNRCLDSGMPAIYCEVVETRGSTPQGAGAAMLVFEDGRQFGTLGGGCVEAEVRQKALAGGSGGTPALLTFTLDKDYGWDDGLICGGRMKVLSAPVTTSDAGYYRNFLHLVEIGAGCTEAVVLEAGRHPRLRVGDRYLFDGDGRLVDRLAGIDLPATVLEHLDSPVNRPRPKVVEGVALVVTPPRCRLIIVGAGHVGQALARLASEVDFDVWVLDDRQAYASEHRFPTARRLIVGDIEPEIARLEIGPRDYCVIVTRGHHHDEEALALLAPTPARYVGLIGSKRKIRLIFDDLEHRGLERAMLARVHAPLGLDIGSVTVPEIALSIAAELIAHRNRAIAPDRRLPGSLSDLGAIR